MGKEKHEHQIEPFTVTFNKKEHTVDVAADVEVGVDIDHELTRQPSKFAWYVVLAEEAADRERRASAAINDAAEQMEDMLVDVRAEIEASYAKSGEKLPTVDGFKAMLQRDERVRRFRDETQRKLRDRLLSAQTLAGKLKGIVKVFDQRGSIIQSKAANKRTELERVDLTTRVDRAYKKATKET